MKSRIIVIDNIKIITVLLIAIIFIAIFVIKIIDNKEKYYDQNVNTQIEKNIDSENTSIENVNKQTINTVASKSHEIKIDFPTEIEGTEVVGKVEIPKINLITYILAETTKETLNKSVTKLCGPKVNGVGNLCITGHNYNNKNMFKDLKKLEIGDKVFITDMKGNKIEYLVYDQYKIYPKETECLSQDTKGEREITLITCTTGAIKRLIVKAREFYD